VSHAKGGRGREALECAAVSGWSASRREGVLQASLHENARQFLTATTALACDSQGREGEDEIIDDAAQASPVFFLSVWKTFSNVSAS
jgi:hypothetical protein